MEIFEGSVNKTRFIQFLCEHVVSEFSNISGFDFSILHNQAPQLNPFPGKKSIVVVDNCSIHHDPQVKELIEGECGMFLFLSPTARTSITPLIETQVHASCTSLHTLQI